MNHSNLDDLNMADLKVFIIESDEFLRGSIRGQLEGMEHVAVAGELTDPSGAQRQLAQHRPDVLLLELGEQPDPALELAEWLRVQHPDTLVLGATASTRPELMRRAMRGGVYDLLARPIDPGQLKASLDEAREMRSKRKQSQQEAGHVTAVLGVSGGIGTTTIATNVAVAMAGTDGIGSVLLADFDLFTGNVPCFLDLHAEHTYHDLRHELDTMDDEGLKQVLPRHRSGLFMLAGPQRLEDLDAITHDDVGRTVDLCRNSFKRVVADAGHGLDDRRIELLDRVDDILLVMQLNVASLHRTTRALEVFDRIGYSRDQVKIVANRFVKGGDVTVEDVQNTLARPVAYNVPNDYRSVIAAIDSGVPLMEGKRSNRVASSIRAMTDDLINLGPDLSTDAAEEAASANGTAAPSGPISRLFRGRQVGEPGKNGNGVNGNGANGNGANGNGHSKTARRGPISRLLSR